MDAGSGGVTFGDTEDLTWLPNQVIAAFLAAAGEKSFVARRIDELQRMKGLSKPKRHNETTAIGF